ncbi:MAG: DoxX family protein [Acidiferrobacter sp.]
MDNKKGNWAVFDLIGRIFLVLIFIFAAIGKILNYHGTTQFMAAHGVPAGLLPIVIGVELLGGIAVIIGLFTRWAALMLAVYSIIAIAIFHHTFNTFAQDILTLAEVGFTGGLILLAVQGPGCLSVDAWLRKK